MCNFHRKHEEQIKQAVLELKKVGLELTMEGNLADFLGVHIEQVDHQAYHLHQRHQIKKVLK